MTMARRDTDVLMFVQNMFDYQPYVQYQGPESKTNLPFNVSKVADARSAHTPAKCFRMVMSFLKDAFNTVSFGSSVGGPILLIVLAGSIVAISVLLGYLYAMTQDLYRAVAT